MIALVKKKEQIEQKRVLVFPGGSEIGLEINRALRDCKDITLFSCNSDISNHSSYVFEHDNILSSVSKKTWINELNCLIEKNNIDYILPAHDEVLLALSEKRKEIRANIILPSKEICRITRSKRKTYRKFQNLIPVPKIYDDVLSAQWPMFLKPDIGQGSENTFLVKNKKEAQFYLSKFENILSLEYLPGKEYTVDCFSDMKGEVLFSGARERLRVRNGISVNSKTVKNKIFKEYAQIISKELMIMGAWFFQVKEDRAGKLKLLEIAPRVSGTMSVYRTLGVNFPLLSLYQKYGLNVEIMINDMKVEVDRVLIGRYKTNFQYDNVYVDFDDTLVFKNKINVGLIKFIYQSINKNKKIFLLTKSKNNIKQALKKYCISEELFDKIIHIKEDDEKRCYIRKSNSIFIDDSFSERKKVAKQNIPTFDLSMLELLIDDRV